MRDILFRGKRLDNGKWHYGSYLFLYVPDRNWAGTPRGSAKDVYYIVDQEDINYAVDPETVGQYTGLDDKNGRKIFEGDILRYFDEKMLIMWRDNGFIAKRGNGKPLEWSLVQGSEIIGNVFDNLDVLLDMLPGPPRA